MVPLASAGADLFLHSDESITCDCRLAPTCSALRVRDGRLKPWRWGAGCRWN